jgi:hypothetical protein
MDNLLTIQNINDLIHNPAIWLLCLWVSREIFHSWKEKGAALSKSMAELTVAIVRLQTKIENLETIAYSVPKLKQDIDGLYRKMRESDSTPT